MNGQAQIAVVTGASSGIGAATAKALAQAGFRLALGARRIDQLSDVASAIESETGLKPLIAPLDVTDVSSSTLFVQEVIREYGAIHVLINNAGLASGVARIAEAQLADEDDWSIMLDTNVLGLLRMSRLVIKHILESGGGHVVNIGSIAGHEAYPGGSAYCGTKFAVKAITSALRQELLGQPVRVTSVDPGMVETEFSVVRYHGDKDRAQQVYAGVTPLTGDDIAQCVLFAVTRPLHVNVDNIVVTALQQAGPTRVARRS